MSLHPLAGQQVPTSLVPNISRLMTAYYVLEPDVHLHPEHKVSFGTSGHRGSALHCSFNEPHVLAICQADIHALHTWVSEKIFIRTINMLGL